MVKCVRPQPNDEVVLLGDVLERRGNRVRQRQSQHLADAFCEPMEYPDPLAAASDLKMR